MSRIINDNIFCKLKKKLKYKEANYTSVRTKLTILNVEKCISGKEEITMNCQK